MMIECPKCAFVQPKDKYCANCGIDMANYKPAKPPYWRQLLKDTTVQVVGVLVVAAGMIAFIYLRTVPFQYPQPSSFIPGSSSETASVSDETPPPEVETKAAATDKLDAQPAPPAPEPDTAPAESSAGDGLAGSAEPAPKPPEQVHIRFAEVSRRFLAQLFQDAGTQVLADTQLYRAVAHKGNEPVAKLKTRDSAGLEFLGTARSVDVALNKPIAFAWFAEVGEATPGAEPAGMNLEFTLTQVSPNQVELVLDGFVRLRLVAGANVNTPVTGTFSFSPADTLVIAGMIPHAAIREDDARALAKHPLAVITSPEFLEGISEFVAFVQVK